MQQLPRTEKESKMKALLWIGAGVAFALVMYSLGPDMYRYAKIKSM